MVNMDNKNTKKNLIIFTLVVLLSGWIGAFVDTLIPDQPQGNSLGIGIWLITPLITTLLLRIFAGDGWQDMGVLPRFKGNLKWYIVSFLIFPLVTFTVTLIGFAIGWIDISDFNIKIFSSIFIGGLLVQFVKNFFEESVWRGYLTSKLLKLKIKDIWLYIIAGSVWGFWHLAYYLIFLPISDIQSVLSVDRLPFASIAVITMIFWTVMYTEIYRISNSIWPLVILHMVEDSLINPLVIDGYIKIAQGKEIFVSPITGVITTLLYLLVGLALRRYRIKKEACVIHSK